MRWKLVVSDCHRCFSVNSRRLGNIVFAWESRGSHAMLEQHVP